MRNFMSSKIAKPARENLSHTVVEFGSKPGKLVFDNSYEVLLL